MRFKLFEISLGNFVIVKNDVDTSTFPFPIHGTITIIHSKKNHYYIMDRFSSKELKDSNEIDTLKQTALTITENELNFRQ